MLHDILHELVDLIHVGDNKRGELHHRIEQARTVEDAPATAAASSDEPAQP